MCIGWYGEDHDRPVINGTIVFPSLEVGHELTFLIDTGADSTCLGGLDAVRAGLTPEDMGDDVEFEEYPIQGVTNSTGIRLREPIMLGFEEYSENHDRWSLHLEVLDEITVLPESPQSLLGRDFLDRFNTEFDPGTEIVELKRRNFGKGSYICLTGDEEIAPDLRDFEQSDDGDSSNDE